MDDYDFIPGLNFIDKIISLFIPFIDYICILDTRKQQCLMLVSRDMRGETNVLSAIQLVENVHYGNNIDLVDWSAKETTLEMLEGQQTDIKPIELSVGLPPKKEVGCASDFGESDDASWTIETSKCNDLGTCQTLW